MRKLTRWSKEEELVLLDQAKRNASIMEAMEKAANILGRTPRACYVKYYSLSKETPMENVETTEEHNCSECWKKLIKKLLIWKK